MTPVCCCQAAECISSLMVGLDAKAAVAKRWLQLHMLLLHVPQLGTLLLHVPTLRHDGSQPKAWELAEHNHC